MLLGKSQGFRTGDVIETPYVQHITPVPTDDEGGLMIIGPPGTLQKLQEFLAKIEPGLAGAEDTDADGD